MDPASRARPALASAAARSFWTSMISLGASATRLTSFHLPSENRSGFHHLRRRRSRGADHCLPAPDRWAQDRELHSLDRVAVLRLQGLRPPCFASILARCSSHCPRPTTKPAL